MLKILKDFPWVGIKEDLLTVIQESWNHFDEEYCFKLVKSMPKRIKALYTKEDLLTVIHETWNHFDKKYCFKLLKSIPERIKFVIKSSRREN